MCAAKASVYTSGGTTVAGEGQPVVKVNLLTALLAGPIVEVTERMRRPYVHI
jgi:hypothetical protein